MSSPLNLLNFISLGFLPNLQINKEDRHHSSELIFQDDGTILIFMFKSSGRLVTTPLFRSVVKLKRENEQSKDLRDWSDSNPHFLSFSPSDHVYLFFFFLFQLSVSITKELSNFSGYLMLRHLYNSRIEYNLISMNVQIIASRYCLVLVEPKEID
jgi:hypothetical protein